MKNILYMLFIILLISIMLLSGITILKNKNDDEKQEDLFNILQNTVINDIDITDNTPINSIKDYSNLFEQNNDMVAWLTINGTNINYPVMQTKKNPNFYLRKNFYKEYSYYGTPYIDERCDAKESDNLIIYGHHIKNNKMFGELEKYKKENYYKEHKIIELTTLDNVYKYEIVFAFKTDIITGFKYFNYYDFKNKEDFNEFYNKCKELSFHTSNSEIKYTDKLITLSTCEYSSENGRLAIIAKRL